MMRNLLWLHGWWWPIRRCLRWCTRWQASCREVWDNNNIIYIIIMHVYIAPEPGNPVLRRFTILLSLTQTCFHPAYISTPKGAYNACCHYRRKALLKHIAITSCQVLIFMDEWKSHDMTALHFKEIRTRDHSATSPTL